MYQLIYASIFHTHYWHEVGMLYLFTMVVACKMDALTSGSGKIYVQTASPVKNRIFCSRLAAY